MALVLANDAAVLDAMLVTPRIGAWHVELHVDSVEPITGRVTISINDGAFVLVGTAASGGEYLDVARLSVVAGANGLGKTARPRRYRSATLGMIVRDLARDAGETIDPASSPAAMAISVADWTTPAIPVGAVLAALFAARAPGIAWRMTYAGNLWVGTEGWPDAALAPGTFELDEDAPEDGTARYTLVAPVPLVATTLEGRRVSFAQQVVTPHGPIEADVWFETDGAASSDRIKDALAALVRAVPPGLDQRIRFWAKVVQQAGGTIHVLPEDPGLADMGEVALVLPPGESADGIAPGARVLVGWSGRDRVAYAEGFQGGAPVSRSLEVTGILALGSKVAAEPPAKAGTMVAAFTALVAALTAYANAKSVPPVPPGPPDAATVALLAALATFTATFPSWPATHTTVG